MKMVSKQELIDDIKNVFYTYNNTTREFYLEHGKYSRAPIKRHFGSWNNVLKSLNIPLNMRKENDIKKEEILQEMFSIYNSYGYLTAELQRKVSTYSQSTIERVFGSFNNMLREMKLPPNSSGNRYNYNAIKETIHNIYEQNNYISFKLIEQSTGLTYQGLSKKYNIHNLKDLCVKFHLNEQDARPDSLAQYEPFNNIIADILQEQPIYEKTFDWFINPKTNKHFRVDMFFQKHNLAIEIDGLDHYKIKKGQYTLYRKNDFLKQDLLLQHNIKTIRIKNFLDNEETIIKLIGQDISA